MSCLKRGAASVAVEWYEDKRQLLLPLIFREGRRRLTAEQEEQERQENPYKIRRRMGFKFLSRARFVPGTIFRWEGPATFEEVLDEQQEQQGQEE